MFGLTLPENYILTTTVNKYKTDFNNNTHFALLGVALMNFATILELTNKHKRYSIEIGDKLEGYISEPNAQQDIYIYGRKANTDNDFIILAIENRHKYNELFERILRLEDKPKQQLVGYLKTMSVS